jgi:hypothetical protein
MKKINLLPFFDLYAGTWSQQDLFKEVLTVYDEELAIKVINSIGKHMLSVGTPSGQNLNTDCVLERFRSNTYDIDLVVDWLRSEDGDLADREHGYGALWVGEGFQIAFKNRPEGAEKYYDPKPALDRVRVIDLKAYFTKSALHISESRKFWNENQSAIADFVGTIETHNAWDIQRFMVKVDNAIADPRVSDAEEAYLILGKLYDISSANYINERLQKIVTDLVLSHPERDARFIVATVPKEVKAGEGRFYHERQAGRHRSGQWGHISDEMIAELLNHFAVTQILPFPPFATNMPIPNGLDLVNLIQERLGRNSQTQYAGYGHGERPGFMHQQASMYRTNFNGPGYSYFNQQMNEFSAPPVSNGEYRRQSHTGGWVWYPNTPLFMSINVGPIDASLPGTLDKLLLEIAKNMEGYAQAGERHINDMLKEIKVTLENHPDTPKLLLENDQVTLFVGRREHIYPFVSAVTDTYFTNWALASGAWNPQEEYKPAQVINTCQGIGTRIPGWYF